MRRALQTVALAALLVVAGCSGPTGQTTTTAPDASPNVTPDGSTPDAAPTEGPPDESTTTDEPQTTASTLHGGDAEAAYPPGVSPDGVTNASALAAAHRAHVVANGATMRTTTRTNGTTSQTVDGTTISVRGNETARLSPDATTLLWTVDATTTQGNETRVLDERYWANESVLVSRVVSAENVTVNVRNRSKFWNRAIVSAAAKTRIVSAALTNAEYTVTNVTERDGRTVTTIVSVNGSYRGQRPVETYDATVTVAASGRVLSLERSWTTDAPTSESQHYDDYTWTTATPVQKPEWTANATATP